MKTMTVLFSEGLVSDSAESNTVNFARRDNYAATCYGYSLSGTVLSATCQTIAGNWISTSIDLENIVGNTNGQLTMRRRAMSRFERRQLSSEMNVGILHTFLGFLR
jgi:hypothetical protein